MQYRILFLQVAFPDNLFPMKYDSIDQIRNPSEIPKELD